MQSAVAKPFGDAEGEEQSSERKAHQGDDEGEPAGVGVRSGGAESSENGLEKHGGEQSCADHR